MITLVRMHTLNVWITSLALLLDSSDERVEYEGLSEKFHKFLTRATSCRSIFDSHASTSKTKRQIILLEDLPNILHPPTQRAFHESLQALISSAETAVVPVVIIVSDAGVRGETGDDASASVSAWKGGAKETVDLRTVIPPALWNSPYVTNFSYAPPPRLAYTHRLH